MASNQLGSILHQLQSATSIEVDGADDARLMELFVDRKDEAAFRTLVARHGPMVFGVCRRLLRRQHDAEDAFQATFLVLVRRASSVRPRQMVGNWLHGVARNIALKTRAKATRHEHDPLPDLPEPVEAQPDLAIDLRPILDRELTGLPERYRLPIILCDLEGKTILEAAGQLGWPQGSVAGRLARGRALLARRLSRYELHLSAGALVAAPLSPSAASASPSGSLVSSTLDVCLRVMAGGKITPGLLSPRVAELANEGVKSMFSKLNVAFLVLAVAATAIGIAAGPHGVEPKAVSTSEPSLQAPKASGNINDVGQFVGARADDANILLNGGMEEGEKSPAHWSEGAEIEGVEYIWDKKTGYKSKASLCLHKTADRYFPVAQWHQTVERTGNVSELRVSAYVKAEKVTKAILDVIFLDGDDKWVSHEWGAYIGAKDPSQAPADHDWKEYAGKVKIPATAKKIRIGLQIYGPGKVWFDDVRAEYAK